MYKFNNISDELLAAYLDGNTTPEENQLVEYAIKIDENLMEVIDITTDIENYEVLYEVDTVLDSDFMLHEILDDRLYMELDSNIENEQISHTDMETNVGFAQAESSWGKPELNIEFDPNTYQYYGDSCAFQSQALILHEFGINVTQEQLMDIALEQGWYIKGYGTPADKVGKLLDYFGVNANFTEGNNIFNLANELSQGHQIIVTVDSGELWNPGMAEHLEDIFWGGRADHALVVVGIDTSDMNDIKIIVSDPGNGNNQLAYSEKQFMDAWKDSNCFMVSTEDSPESFALHSQHIHLETFADIPYESIQSLSIDNIDIDNDYYAEFFNKLMENPDELSSLIEEYHDTVFSDEIDDNNDIS